MKLKLISSALITAILLSCYAPKPENTQNNQDSETPTSQQEIKQSIPKIEDWKTFAKDNYQLQYPSNWELDAQGKQGTKFILYSPMESNTDQFRENINMVTEYVNDSKMSLETYFELSKKNIKASFPKIKELEAKLMASQKPYPYYKYVYSDVQQGMELIWEQHFALINQNAYIVTFTMLADTKKDIAADGRKILETCIIQ